MTIETGIDLNFCVPGQKVRLRSGGIADYLGLIENNISLVYLHQLSSGKYVSNGCYWSDQRTDELDVVEILPLKSPMNIDLNTCVPGQKLERCDGTCVDYESKFNDPTYDYPHLAGGESYTRDGYYRLSRIEDSYDIVKILPLKSPMTIETGIDLNTCVRGQKVKLRDETIATYDGVIDENEIYPHVVGGHSYTKRGTFWNGDGRTSSIDIIEILPLEEEPAKPTPLKSPMNIDLNTCVPGQKVRFRNGAIVEYSYSYQDNSFKPYTHRVDGCSYMDDGSYFKGRYKSEMDVVEILPLEYDYKISEKEEEPAKASPELTHSITDQIDVTNPDHVSIIPHEHGVTISIKKGLTTISWRHYNH
jgi:hypothetical protein